MSNLTHPDKILYLDIETAALAEHYTQMSGRMPDQWELKADSLFARMNPEEKEKYMAEDDSYQKLYEDRAALHTAFSRIVCISFGFVSPLDETQRKMQLRSYYGEDEKEILEDFAHSVNKWSATSPQNRLAAHNGKFFDFPLLARKYMLHGLVIPYALNIIGKKPWEIQLVDTMEIWKMGVYNAAIKLDTLSAAYGLPSPKAEMSGADVNRYFWDGRHQDIAEYCELDISTLANCYICMYGERQLVTVTEKV